jgi:hypothetical protein
MMRSGTNLVIWQNKCTISVRFVWETKRNWAGKPREIIAAIEVLATVKVNAHSRSGLVKEKWKR